MANRFQKISLKYGLFIGIGLVLMVQLLILTVLFSSSRSTSKQLVAVEISPGAVGWLRGRDAGELLKYVSPQPNGTINPIHFLLPNQTLRKRGSYQKRPISQDGLESQQRRIDIRKANAQKRAMEEDYDAERAPRMMTEMTEMTKLSTGTNESVKSPPNSLLARDDGEVPRNKRIGKPSMLLNHSKEVLAKRNDSAKHTRVKIPEIRRISNNNIPQDVIDNHLAKPWQPELLDSKRDSVYVPKKESVHKKDKEVEPPQSRVNNVRQPDDKQAEAEKDKMLGYWKRVLSNNGNGNNRESAIKREGTPVKMKSIKERQVVKDLLTRKGFGDDVDYFKEVCQEATEPLVECNNRTPRELTPREEAGMNIMYTIRTTKAYHTTRLPILLETWLSMVDSRTVFIVSDGVDDALDETLENIGMNYINAHSGTTHNRTDLCCKAGVELEMLFQPGNEEFDWVCHVDDDIYVYEENLIKIFARFDAKKEPIYFGRAGSEWGEPRVVKNTSKIGRQGQKYHFAVGGIYCLSRAMLELAKPYLVGCEAFNKSCQLTQEPEDVTVGLIIGAVLRKELSRTQMIYTHGLDLISTAPSPFLSQQIAFSHGYGSLKPWNYFPNVVFVPGALYNIDEDITQFRSIHCHLYPTLESCIEQKKQVYEAIKADEGKPKSRKDCYCNWQNLMCCEVYRESYATLMSEKLAELKRMRKLQNSKNKTVTDEKEIVKEKG